MSILTLSALKNAIVQAVPTFSFSSASRPTKLPYVSEEDDCFRFEPPIQSNFFECHILPEGEGVAQIQSLLAILPEVSFKEGPWISGGAPRRLLQGRTLEEGDIDFFFKTKEQWAEFTKALEPYELIIETKRAKTFNVNGLKVQMINRKYYENLESVFKDFDFSVCQVATDGVRVAHTRQAKLDVDAQLIRFAPQGSVAKHTLVQRVSKYVGHGFMPEPGLFELIVKSGLDYVSAWSIFEGAEVAIYDEQDGSSTEGEEILSVSEVDEAVMRDCARRLGLEITNG